MRLEKDHWTDFAEGARARGWAVCLPSYVLAPEAEEGDEPETFQPVIVAESTTRIHTLTVGEAVMRMDLADLPVMMFRNSGNGRLNVVYRRNDGHIGWVDPSDSENS